MKSAVIKLLTFLICACVLCLSSISGQTNAIEEAHEFETDRFSFAPGSMFANNGDTIPGYIKWGVGSRSRNVLFKTQEGKSMKCSAVDYVGFIRKGRQYYSCTVNYGFPVFLSLVSKDRLSIYLNEVTYEGKSSYGAALNALDGANNHSLFLIKEGEAVYFHMAKSGFKSKLKKYFSDCPELLKYVKEEKLKYDDFFKISEYYNSRCL